MSKKHSFKKFIDKKKAVTFRLTYMDQQNMKKYDRNDENESSHSSNEEEDEKKKKKTNQVL